MISNVDIKDWKELFGDETLINVPRDSVVSFQDSPEHLWRFHRIDGVWAHVYDLYDTDQKSVWFAPALAKVKIWGLAKYV